MLEAGRRIEQPADTYVFMTNMSVDAPAAAAMRAKLRELGMRKPLILGRQYDSLATSIGRNVKSAADHGMLDPLLVDAAVLSVFSRILELDKAKAVNARSGPINQKELDEFILDRLEASIRVGDLAEYLKIDPVALNAVFKQKFNVSPYHYIQSLRVERSKELLRNGGMPLSELAASLGYSDQSHFNRIFRKYTGFTPTAFRNLG